MYATISFFLSLSIIYHPILVLKFFYHYIDKHLHCQSKISQISNENEILSNILYLLVFSHPKILFISFFHYRFRTDEDFLYSLPIWDNPVFFITNLGQMPYLCAFHPIFVMKKHILPYILGISFAVFPYFVNVLFFSLQI